MFPRIASAPGGREYMGVSRLCRGLATCSFMPWLVGHEPAAKLRFPTHFSSNGALQVRRRRSSCSAPEPSFNSIRVSVRRHV